MYPPTWNFGAIWFQQHVEKGFSFVQVCKDGGLLSRDNILAFVMQLST